MKTATIALFVALTISAPAIAFAGGSVELVLQPDSSSTHPSGNLFLSKTFDSGLGASAFAQVTEGWAQIYAGPTWAPAQWLELSLSAGFEQTGSKLGLRFGSSVWAGYKSFSFLGLAEFNSQSFVGDDSGVWFDLTSKYQPNSWLTIGAKYRRFVGLGPMLEISPTTSTAIWMNWSPIDPEMGDGDTFHPDRFLVGVKGQF